MVNIFFPKKANPAISPIVNRHFPFIGILLYLSRSAVNSITDETFTKAAAVPAIATKSVIRISLFQNMASKPAGIVRQSPKRTPKTPIKIDTK